VRGRFLGGCSGQWEADDGGPRRTESPEWRKGVAVVFSGLG
jgi:hypothetical protein